jgi:hypothetical protein
MRGTRVRISAASLVPVLMFCALVAAAEGGPEVADGGSAAAGSAGTGPGAAQAASPGAQVPALSTAAERAAVTSALGSWQVSDFLAAMDADRLLLNEVRKDIPQVRSEADAYMKRLKELASISDPVKLVPKVNRMMEQAPIYYDFIEKNIQDQNQAANEYVVGGARGFLVAYQDFQNAVLLTVITRLEIAENALRGAAGVSPG